MTKVAILGSGQVGEALAKGFLANGHAVMRGSREPAKLGAWKEAAVGDASIGTFAETAAWGDLIVLAVKGSAAQDVLVQAGIDNFTGKTVIDTTNPIADEKPNNGVIRYFTKQNESLMELLQAKAPRANFVKAFNSVGNKFMFNPPFAPRASMFTCGNDVGAKQQTAKILEQFGWDVVDLGGVEAARPIESLCMLWCVPGITRNEWAHAFKWLKLG